MNVQMVNPDVASAVSDGKKTVKMEKKKLKKLTRYLPSVDLLQLRARCLAPIADIESDFVKAGGVIGGNPQDGFFAFKDNGSNILAVAHLDHVQQSSHFAYDKGFVFCARLDDRLGVYTVLNYLPKLGINVDILLTEGEESCRSTASLFKPPRQYYWAVEFDRKGTDAVVYDYNGFEAVVAKYFPIGIGSFSDIVSLEHLECKALNVGVGYHDEHSVNSFMVVREFLLQMARFREFWEYYKDTAMPHTPRPKIDWKHWDVYGDFLGSCNGYGILTNPAPRQRAVGYPREHAEQSWFGFSDEATLNAAKEEWTEKYGEDMELQCEFCGEVFFESQTLTALNGWMCPACGRYIE